MFRAVAPVCALLLLGCTDFPTPAELADTTVLAVVADPPIARPGGTARLTVAVADHEGPVTLPLAWAMTEATPGVPPMGAIADNGDGTATYTAPDPVPPLPEGVLPIDSVQVTIAATRPIVAVKAVGVADVASANPTITDVTIGGQSALAGLTIDRGATLDVAAVVDPAPGERAAFAWYATAGAIERYQSNPTQIVGGDAAGTYWLYVVVRDGLGGVAWRGVQVTVR